MKKITSILAVLLLMVANTAFAQYKAGDKVTAPVAGEKYLIDVKGNYVTTSGLMTASAEDDTYLWEFEAASDGAYYMKANDGKYIQLVSGDQILKMKEGLDGYDIYGYAGFNFTMGTKASAIPVKVADGTIEFVQELWLGSNQQVYYMGCQGTNVAMTCYNGEYNQTYIYKAVKKTVEMVADELIEKCNNKSFPSDEAMPGCPGMYPAEKVAAYNDALETLAMDKTQENIDVLKAALADVEASMNPVVGTFRILNSLNAFEETHDVPMAVYVNTDNKNLLWKGYDETADPDPSMVWVITKDEKGYTIKNYMGDYFLGSVAQSANASASTTAVPYAIEVLGDWADEHDQPCFTLYPVGGGAYQHFHAGGHGGGSGSSGNIVGWTADSSNSASGWWFKTVTDDELEVLEKAKKEAEEAAKQAELDNKLATLVETAIGKYQMNVDKSEITGDKLLTEAGQISAYGQEPTEGDIESLLDGYVGKATIVVDDFTSITTNFFHSKWSGATDDYHSLNFDLKTPQQVVCFESWRRVGQTSALNLPTNVELYASNDSVEWKKVWVLTTATAGLPSSSLATSDTVYVSPAVDLGAAYQYIKFVVKATNNGATADGVHPFFTYSEFNWYPATIAEDATIKSMPAAPALLSAIRAAMNVEKATQDDIDALQKALDAFMSDFADPTALNEKISEVYYAWASSNEGEDPGMISTQASDELGKAIQAAMYVRDSTNYTKQTLAEAVETLDAAYAKFTTSIVTTFKMNHWYYIRTHSDNTAAALRQYIYSDQATAGNKNFHWTTALPTLDMENDSIVQLYKGYMFRLIPADAEGTGHVLIQNANGLFVDNENQGSDSNAGSGIVTSPLPKTIFKIYDSTMGEGGYEIRQADDKMAALHTSASGRWVNWANNGNKGSHYFWSVPATVLEELGITGDFEVDYISSANELLPGQEYLVKSPVEIIGVTGEAYYCNEDGTQGDPIEVDEDTGLVNIPAGTVFLYTPMEDDAFVFGTKAEACNYAYSEHDGTGVNELVATPVVKADGKVYNVAGQRVAKAVKGLYIVDGKKVVK